MSFISFVGGSLGSILRFDVVDETWEGVMQAGTDDMLVMTGDDDLLFDSLLQCKEFLQFYGSKKNAQ